MKRKKHIDDLFREGESQLRERPSPQAWHRLESRLNQPRVTGGSTLYRRLAMAAALLLLISLVAILPLYLQPGGQTRVASNGEVILLTDQPGASELPSYRPVAIHETYANVALREGDRAKRLTVALRNSDRLNQPPATEDPIQSPTPLTEKELEETAEESLADRNASPEGPQTESESAGGYEESTTIIAEEPDIPAEPMAPVESYDMPEEYTSEDQATAKRRDVAPPRQSVTQMDAATNAIQFSAAELDPQVRQFQWLIGQWQTDEGIGASVETWRLEDEFTITGKGRLTLNGQEIFTEEMEIRKVGDQLYFITATEEGGDKRYFQLRSYENDTAVFENTKDAASPRQLIIRQLDSDNFMTTFSEEETAEPLPAEQQNYLQYRNAVEPDRATRNLSRIGN